MPKDGSPPTLWQIRKAHVGGVTGFEVDEQFVYCSSGPSIFALDHRAGTHRELVSNQQMAGPMRKLGKDLYFVNNRAVIGTGENMAVLRAGGGAPLDLGPVWGQVVRLLHDEQRQTLHWVTGLSPVAGKVAVLHLDTRRTELLLENVDVMGNSAADEDYIYWPGDQALLRLQK
jgi:hypothetical protein